MASRRVLAGLVACLSLTLTHSTYLVTCPQQLQVGRRHVVWVYLDHFSSPTNVTASLSLPSGAPLVSQSQTLTLPGALALELLVPEELRMRREGWLQVQCSGGLRFLLVEALPVFSRSCVPLIQTDKAVYKPGQTVRMRVMAMDSNRQILLQPLNISVHDNQGNLIMDWIKVENSTGVVTRELELSDQPPLGDWTISVSCQDGTGSKSFSVEKYVLPRFEVSLEAEPAFLVRTRDPNFKVIVKARYTYGKPVVGNATVTVFSMNSGFSQSVPVQVGMGQDGRGGEAVFSSEELLGRQRGLVWWEQRLQVLANVSEGGAGGPWRQASLELPVYSHAFRLTFLPASTKVVRRGLPILVQLAVTDQAGRAAAAVNETVELSLGRETVKLRVPPSGLLQHHFRFDPSLSVSAVLRDQHAFWYLRSYQSSTNLSMRLSSPHRSAAVGETFNFSIETNAKKTGMPVSFFVMARGVLLLKKEAVAAPTARASFAVTSEMAPEAVLVAMSVVDKEILADSLQLSVTVPARLVNLKFSADVIKAGEAIDLEVTSDPWALVCVLAVDKSVELLGTGNDITNDDVLAAQRDLDPGLRGRAAAAAAADLEDPLPLQRHRKRRTVLHLQDFSNDAKSILTNAGLACWTDLKIALRPWWGKEDVEEMHVAMPDKDVAAEQMRKVSNSLRGGTSSSGEHGPAPVSHVRQLFPETWIWQDALADAQGRAVFSSRAPDTITSWLASALAVGRPTSSGSRDTPPSGTRTLALTQLPAQVTVFQEFFLELRLPYSLQRGETFQLLASLHNYLASPLDVRLTLAKSPDFAVVSRLGGQELLRQEEVVDTVRVQALQSRQVHYWIAPSRVGLLQVDLKAQALLTSPDTPPVSDHVRRSVLVTPPGIRNQRSAGLVVQLTEEAPVASFRVPLDFPPSPVPDSRRVEVQITGDVMGPALQGLGGLLQVPVGCGEQNMITLVPNIFVSHYLQAAGRLTPQLQERAVKNMRTGYQRELTFRHTGKDQGAFSAFGDSDVRGSTWLTAFVVKSFAQAAPFISVERSLFQQAFAFVASTQRKSGAFQEVGRVIHTEMQSGGGGGGRLTAYVLVALLEARDFLGGEEEEVVQRAAAHLGRLLGRGQVSSLYDKAVLAYALALAGDASLADQLLQDILDGGEPLPWTESSQQAPRQEAAAAREVRAPAPARALAVETGGYLLLALLARGKLALARSPALWLLRQQEPGGGFRSTQDTVLALQALAQYAEQAMGDGPPAMMLRVEGAAPSSGSSVLQEYSLTPDNALRLHSMRLPSDVEMVTVNATGVGFAIVKVVWQYHVMKDAMLPSDGDVTIKARASAVKLDSERARVRTCLSCQRDVGMTVVTLGLLSGFVPDLPPQLPPLVRRQEVKDNQLHLYLDKAPEEEACLDVNMVVSEKVENVLPVEVKAYAYYSPEIMTEGMYALARGGAVNCRDCRGDDCPPECTSNGTPPLAAALSPLPLLALALLLAAAAL